MKSIKNDDFLYSFPPKLAIRFFVSDAGIAKLEDVKNALTAKGIVGLTVSEVRGFGRQRGHKEQYRGAEYTVDFLPKIKLEIVLANEQLDAAVAAIVKSAKTGKIGDGKVFVSTIEEAIRIRTEAKGEQAV